ncbi:MAG: helix-turn-helix transcriptional regulator [Candidatus Accumulibacter sp.]|jgi:transcriptional regulator with XRE-family HTH domain|nr:helix-turn-helix transcriptional regulator [Accumulibacter sp.]
MNLSDRIKQLLEKTGATQAQLARAAKVKPSSVSAWLSGKTKNILGEPALNIADFYKIEISWLVKGIGSMYSPKSINPRDEKNIQEIYGLTKCPVTTAIIRTLLLPEERRKKLDAHIQLAIRTLEMEANQSLLVASCEGLQKEKCKIKDSEEIAMQASKEIIKKVKS